MLRPLFETTLVIAAYVTIAAVAIRALARLGYSTRDGTAIASRTAPIVVAILANLAIAAVALGLFTVLDPRSIADLGWTLNGQLAVTSLLVVVVTFGVAIAVARAGGARRSRVASPAYLRRAVSVAIPLLAAAWMEEVVFRAYLLTVLSAAGEVVAVLVSTALFTVVHLPTNRVDRYRVVGWALGGLTLAAIYLISESMWVATAAHLARNLANILVVEPTTEVGVVTWPRPIAPWSRTLYVAAWAVATIVTTVFVIQ